ARPFLLLDKRLAPSSLAEPPFRLGLLAADRYARGTRSWQSHAAGARMCAPSGQSIRRTREYVPAARLHAGGAPGCDRDHRRADWIAPTCLGIGAQRSASRPVRQQHAPDWL